MEIVKNLLKGKGIHFLTDNIRKNRYFREDDLILNHIRLDDLLMNLDKEMMICYFYLYHEKMDKWLYRGRCVFLKNYHQMCFLTNKFSI